MPREERFRVLVAANLCAVVARELRAGEAPMREDLTLFNELLGMEGGEPPPDPERLREAVGEAELAARLRAGELDDRLEELGGRLAAHVRRKLEVARPGYDSAWA